MGSGGHDLGRRGEQIAAQYLTDAGYELVARNWRGDAGEVDLVARVRTGAGHGLVFCEVKTRSTTRWGDPACAVGLAKQGRLRRVAAEFLARGPGRRWTDSVRFDVIEVVITPGDRLPQLIHLEDAFP